jgi:hypothetical protein
MTPPDPRAEIRRLFDAQVANRWAVAASTAGQRIERLTRRFVPTSASSRSRPS